MPVALPSLKSSSNPDMKSESITASNSFFQSPYMSPPMPVALPSFTSFVQGNNLINYLSANNLVLSGDSLARFLALRLSLPPIHTIQTPNSFLRPNFAVPSVPPLETSQPPLETLDPSPSPPCDYNEIVSEFLILEDYDEGAIREETEQEFTEHKDSERIDYYVVEMHQPDREFSGSTKYNTLNDLVNDFESSPPLPSSYIDIDEDLMGM